MSVSKAFKALGNQPLEEQNLLISGLATIEKFFKDRKINKKEDMRSKQAELLSKKLKSELDPKTQKKQMKI